MKLRGHLLCAASSRSNLCIDSFVLLFKYNLFHTSIMMFSKKTMRAMPALIGAASAASFPPQPTGLSIVNSTHFPGVTISYKEVRCLPN
jgi:hypothetical protein